MKTKVARRRSKPKAEPRLESPVVDRPDAPIWDREDPKELMRRLPSFQALELAGAIDARHRAAGDHFASAYRLASLHDPTTTARYGAGPAGAEIDEAAQDAARRRVSRSLRLAGPASSLLVALARDERPALRPWDVTPLRSALEAIA